jgi:hypothetical protein
VTESGAVAALRFVTAQDVQIEELPWGPSGCVAPA